MSAYWVVVANASRVRIFEADANDSAMREIVDMANPASRLHESELISDHGGHGNYHEDAARQHQTEIFAHEVCDRLEHGRLDGSYRKLYLVAAPQFLGLLRKHMERPLHDVVQTEISKDLTTAEPARIRAQVM